MNFQTALPEEDVNRESARRLAFKGGRKIYRAHQHPNFGGVFFQSLCEGSRCGSGRLWKSTGAQGHFGEPGIPGGVQDAETQERIIKTFDLLELKRGDRVLLSRLSGKAEAEQTFGAIRIADIVSQKPLACQMHSA